MSLLPRIPAIAICILLATASAAGHEVSTRSWIDGHGVRWTETTESFADEPGVRSALGGDGGEEQEDFDPGPIMADRFVATRPAAQGLAQARPPHGAPLASFGPFAVLDSQRAILMRETDTSAPRDFARMLAAYPGIRVLELFDCPGTLDDNANLVLGRMIHQRGIETVVPPGGSVRSGAVDLFLAGVRRTAAADAEFAVHAWLDEDGLRPTNFSPSSPVNRKYVVFYHQAGGMPLTTAKAFYDLTNSVPNERALWLSPRDISRYAAIEVR